MCIADRVCSWCALTSLVRSTMLGVAILSYLLLPWESYSALGFVINSWFVAISLTMYIKLSHHMYSCSCAVVTGNLKRKYDLSQRYKDSHFSWQWLLEDIFCSRFYASFKADCTAEIYTNVSYLNHSSRAMRHRPSQVHIMACRLLETSHYVNQCWENFSV